MSQNGPGDGDVRAPVPSAPTEALPEDHLGLGSVVGERYQIRSRLGRGGMGEVWLAYDLKLRVEVALKALRPDLMADGERLELLRQEVRAAREVTSPNVCRIFDLVELDGRELVSMEYVDGTTLLDVLVERAPLEPTEAQDIASQFLAGLEAIHQAGLVHRDVKPENIMITRTGRVVVMDFGLARSAAEGAGSVSGTPAYMAPEQARGEAADARADLFSAGVVLAEMVSPEGLRDFESRQSVWNGIRKEPIELSDSPWKPVVRKAVESQPENRFASAHELTRALEEVAFRVHDEEGLEPYPGLSAFSEEDAAYFFGREAEVEAVWKKLQSTHLLAIVGASGTGKSSFIGAGLMPTRPEGWATARCTPGKDALTALRAAVVAEIEEDSASMRRLAAGGDDAIVEVFSQWRKNHDQALFIIDQFEELFTQNSGEEQARVAGLIRRFVLDADVHMVLGMRDDFLLRCHDHEALAPVFSELTPLRTPVGGALRRAVVQPALKCGYRFEDEELADEILAEVEGERGALPLLAFALSQLWERRDRENGLLTRQAYQEIGGVGGALAQHAEATVARIGEGGQPILRELFRNLVTAQGTRAAWEVDELLTIFEEDERGSSRRVLDELIDARLLTSYEVQTSDGSGRQQVEIVHESLLERWPRLVRWRTQDADSARLRDELRRAALIWEEHQRARDYLWTGKAYREYAVWREDYPGGLTDQEQDFAHAMTLLATRRRRRRRLAVTTAMILVVILAGVFASLWQRSERETRRAEAQKLLALGQLDLEGYPTATLAYATASLELIDTPEARQLMLEALWRGPPASLIVPEVAGDYWIVNFSPDGRWLAASNVEEEVLVYPSSGAAPIVLGGHVAVGGPRGVIFDSSSRYLATGAWWGTDMLTRIWSLPEGRLLRALDLDEHGWYFPSSFAGEKFVTVRPLPEADDRIEFLAWTVTGGEPRTLGVRRRVTRRPDFTLDWSIDPVGQWLAEIRGNEVFLIPLDRLSDGPAMLVATHEDRVRNANFTVDGNHLVTEDASGEFRVWAIDGAPMPSHVLDTAAATGFDDFGDFDSFTANSGDGSRIARKSEGDKTAFVWDLEGPPDAEPLMLRREGAREMKGMAFSPDRRWLAEANGLDLSLWPLDWRQPKVLDGIREAPIYRLVFTPDSSRLLVAAGDGVSIWPLNPGAGDHYIPGDGHGCYGLAVDPEGHRFVRFNPGGPVTLVSLSDESSEEPPRVLLEVRRRQPLAAGALTFDPTGRLVVAGSHWHAGGPTALRVVDLETGKVKSFPLQEEGPEPLPLGGVVWDLEFAPDGTLYSGGVGGVRRWNVETGEHDWVLGNNAGALSVSDLSDDGRWLLAAWDAGSGTELRLVDLVENAVREITSHGGSVYSIALGPEGDTIVTGGVDGVVRVSAADGGEPHLLLGHEGSVDVVAVSPDGRWIVSGAGDEIRLWPMPDLSEPPLHTLPHEELVTKLKTLTNLRVVRDLESSTGWRTEVGPFPGWETVPTW